VNIPKLMIEAKASYVATNGLNFWDAAMTRLDWLSRMGSRISSVANWAIGNRQARVVMEKLLGIAQGRKLPRFARRSFLRTAARLRLTRPTRRTGRKVVYFVDTYANYHDTALAESLVGILEHNGIAVYVHPAQSHSAMSMISLGALDKARSIARKNVTLLAEAIRQGYHVVTTEPAAALCLSHEYLHLFDDDDTRLVSQNTSEACAYLWQLHQGGGLQLDFKPVHAHVAYHLPCHLKALNVGSPGENLLRLIPGLKVARTERGCSGMAGTFGFKRENYRNSLRAGWGLISALRDPAIQLGATECSSCKIQMEQGTTKPTIHTLKLLALAYGLRTDFRSLLTARGHELIVT
jgi:Fe-S oxidoreductase